MNRIRAPHAVAWSAGLVALALYVGTAAPGIVELFDDTLEFQVVGPTFGIAHPTGYPLYVLLSGLWTRVLFPFGEWAWRMNLFSAFTGAAAVALTAFLGARLARSSPPLNGLAGLAAAAAFALGPVWWSQTTEAEVYALHLLFVVLILNRTLSISEQSDVEQADIEEAEDARPVSHTVSNAMSRHMTWLCLLVGLGLAHHRTTVLILPGVALVLLWKAPRLLQPSRAWLRWIAALIAPLLLYLWIPLRAAMGVRDLHGSYENTWQGFWDHVLARRYVAFFSENPLMIERTFLEWIELFVRQMGWLALTLALIGLLQPVIFRRATPGWTLVLLMLAANLLFAVNYRVGDVEVFLLPAFLSIALLAALGLDLLAGLLLLPTTAPSGEPRPRLQIARQTINLGLLLVVAGLVIGIGGRGAFASRAQDWQAHDAAYLMATADFPPDSRVIGLEGEITALRYMQLANGLAPNAQGIVANLPEARQQAIAQAVEQGAAVFITREVEGIGDRYHFSSVGSLVQVHPLENTTDPEPLGLRIDYALEGAPLVLEAAEWNTRALPGGPRLELALDWRLLQPVEQTYKLSLRLLHGPRENPQPLPDPQGEPIVLDVFPIRQTALTHQWPVDRTIRDVHQLPLPAHLTNALSNLFPGDAYIQVIIYDGESIEEVGRWETPLLAR